MGNVSKDVRLVAVSLGALAALVAASIGLYGFQRWLEASGGWALMVAGLVCLWSTIMIVLTVVGERRRRRRERAIDAALAEIRRALALAPAPRDDEQGDERAS